MNIKSLLIGSAALMTVSSGAYAADAVVMAEPEPVEYVRVCDVYGAGFFYIPGTETCLKIGGYVRAEVGNLGSFGLGGGTGDWTGYGTRFRAEPQFDVRSETELGTLRGFADLRFDWVSGATGVTLNQGFIELTTGSGTLHLGKTDTPYARFLGYGGPFGPFDGSYAFRNTMELSYTFNGGNGFSGIIALLDNLGSLTWATDVEGGIKFQQGWGYAGLIAGYDSVFSTWGAKGRVHFQAPNSGFSGGVMVMYASGAGAYAITDPGAAAPAVSHWSVMGYAGSKFSPTLAANVSAQWFSYTGGWQFTGGLNWTPVANLSIKPEIRYLTTSSTWDGIIRFDRSF